MFFRTKDKDLEAVAPEGRILCFRGVECREEKDAAMGLGKVVKSVRERFFAIYLRNKDLFGFFVSFNFFFFFF